MCKDSYSSFCFSIVFVISVRDFCIRQAGVCNMFFKVQYKFVNLSTSGFHQKFLPQKARQRLVAINFVQTGNTNTEAAF